MRARVTLLIGLWFAGLSAHAQQAAPYDMAGLAPGAVFAWITSEGRRETTFLGVKDGRYRLREVETLGQSSAVTTYYRNRQGQLLALEGEGYRLETIPNNCAFVAGPCNSQVKYDSGAVEQLQVHGRFVGGAWIYDIIDTYGNGQQARQRSCSMRDENAIIIVSVRLYEDGSRFWTRRIKDDYGAQSRALLDRLISLCEGEVLSS